MGVSPDDPSLKRKRPTYDSGEDDEEFVPVKEEHGLKEESPVKQRERTGQEPEATQGADGSELGHHAQRTSTKRASKNAKSATQWVYLNWYTTTGAKRRRRLKERSVACIGAYNSNLADAKDGDEPGDSIEITDPDQHDEDDMCLMFQYITSRGRSRRRWLDTKLPSTIEDAWSLCVLAATLQISHLVQALQKHVAGKLRGLSLLDWDKAVGHCCAPGQALKVSSGDAIGKSIKKFLSGYLPALDKCGYIDQIEKRDDAVKDLLVEVLLGRYTARIRKRADAHKEIVIEVLMHVFRNDE